MRFDEINDNHVSFSSYIQSIMRKQTSKNRVKRYDKKMKNDCSSHETGLAIAYYAILFRHYIE